MCFIETLIIAGNISDMLAQIDHKGPNWAFLTLKITYRLIPDLSYCRNELVSHQITCMMQYIWAALRYY